MNTLTREMTILWRVIQAGPIQAGPIQAGPIQAGPIQAGPDIRCGLVQDVHPRFIPLVKKCQVTFLWCQIALLMRKRRYALLV